MVDMHIHSIYSDGDKTIREILKMCEEKKLEYISITDHNTCRQYNDKTLLNNDIFNGKIIKGVELYAVFQDKSFEILGYNVDVDIINNWSEKYYSEDKLIHEQKTCAQRLLNACDKLNLVYNKDNIEKRCRIAQWNFTRENHGLFTKIFLFIHLIFPGRATKIYISTQVE